MFTQATFLVLSPLNEMGVKGAGEATAIPAGLFFTQTLAAKQAGLSSRHSQRLRAFARSSIAKNRSQF